MVVTLAASFTNTQAQQNRQMVMDDAYVFFDAEPAEKYDSKLRLRKDVGWYLKSHLRILGTFSQRSAFQVKVKKSGQELSSIRCEGKIYTKSGDTNLRSAIKRRGRDLSYDDFMKTDLRCFDKEAINKQIGKMVVEVYFINGDTDEEKLVRTYKIDVHKATKVRGSASRPQPDVSDYYIQRHAEAAVAVAYFMQSNVKGDYFVKPIENFGTKTNRLLHIYTTFSPAAKGYPPSKTFTRCTVNGVRIDFSGNLNRDNVGMYEDQSRREVGIYTDRKSPKYRRGSAYKDQVEFTGLTFKMPIYSGKDNSSLNLIKLEDNPGQWECKIVANGKIYRTFRWEAANGKIVSHAEQKNGNINLFYDAALIDMKIPRGGSPGDYRLMPMPNAGLFYGIPWTSSEGKKMAASVPKKGRPFHVSSTRAN